jgi:hypothetical protein
MANKLTWIDTTANTMLNAMVAVLDAGTEALMKFYTAGNVLICTLTMNATSFPAAAAGVLTANAITQGTCGAAGTVTYCTFCTSAGVELFRCTVGVGASYDINISNTTFAIGDIISCSALTVTLPLNA